MSTSSDPREDQSGDHLGWKSAENKMTRLRLIKEMIVSALGGVWPEQPGELRLRRVLDVGCSVGCWLFHAARMYPQIEKLYGVDADPRLIARARQIAQEQQMGDRLEFSVMDALSMLEFPFDYLDLVNIEMGGWFLRTWEWSKMLQESLRVARSGGIIRVVEQNFLGESTSPALNRLMRMLVEVMYQSGHLFAPECESLSGALPRLFTQFGVKETQTRPYTLEFSPVVPGWSAYSQSIPYAITPLLAKWGRLPGDYDELCQQALYEMVQPDFVVRWRLLVVWGHK